MSAPEPPLDIAGADSRPVGAVERLLEVERSAAETLARARAEAEDILASARRRAADREEAVRAEIERAAAGLERDILARREERLAALRSETAAHARDFEEAGDATVRALGARIVDALLERTGEGPG